MEAKLLRDHMPRLASWMRWPRSFILHGMPVVLAWADLLSNGSSIRAAHMAKGGGPGQQAWAMLSFFALTTAYEALVPEPGGSQYDVKMPQKKFVAITKVCALALVRSRVVRARVVRQRVRRCRRSRAAAAARTASRSLRPAPLLLTPLASPSKGRRRRDCRCRVLRRPAPARVWRKGEERVRGVVRWLLMRRREATPSLSVCVCRIEAARRAVACPPPPPAPPPCHTQPTLTPAPHTPCAAHGPFG